MAYPKSSLRAFVYSPLPADAAGRVADAYGYVKEETTTIGGKKASKRRFLLRQQKRQRIDNPWRDQGLHAATRRQALATLHAWADGKPVTSDMFVELDDSDAS